MVFKLWLVSEYFTSNWKRGGWGIVSRLLGISTFKYEVSLFTLAFVSGSCLLWSILLKHPLFVF